MTIVNTKKEFGRYQRPPPEDNIDGASLVCTIKQYWPSCSSNYETTVHVDKAMCLTYKLRMDLSRPVLDSEYENHSRLRRRDCKSDYTPMVGKPEVSENPSRMYDPKDPPSEKGEGGHAESSWGLDRGSHYALLNR